MVLETRSILEFAIRLFLDELLVSASNVIFSSIIKQSIKKPIQNKYFENIPLSSLGLEKLIEICLWMSTK